jgi:CheY-like chemotaxis protein
VPSLQNEPQPSTAPSVALASTDRSQTGILLCRDLIFTTKIQGTARSLGYRIEVVHDVSNARVEIESLRPRVILIDLTAGELSGAAAMSDYVSLAGPETWVVAFGPHVEVEALARAKAAGCQVVLPRSKFAGDLPRLLQFYFSQHPGRD